MGAGSSYSEWLSKVGGIQLPPSLDGQSKFEVFPNPAELSKTCWNVSVVVNDAFGGKTPPRFFYANRPIPVTHWYIPTKLEVPHGAHLWMRDAPVRP